MSFKKEFLELLDKDVEFRYAVAGYLGLEEIIKRLDKQQETTDKLLASIDKLWESNNKLWEEVKALREGQDKLWQENQKIWEELKSLREDMQKGFAAHEEEIQQLREDMNAGFQKHEQEIQQLREDMNAGFQKHEEEMRKLREDMNAGFQKHEQEIQQLREDMQKGFAAHEERFERMETKLTALGSRWGIDSEVTFRNAMRGLLEKDFHVKVQNLILMDDEGFVFGSRGVPIEYDVVVMDGGATLIEIKASVGRDDVYVFLRKIEFYKKRMGMEVKRAVIASPFFERDSADIARKLGLEVYTGSKPKEGEAETEEQK
ncbi:DUF3782 domain-containing protein [Tardisphaera miroshnichenkoae]